MRESMKKVVKLTTPLLKKIVLEEVEKMKLEEADALETVESHADDADELDDAGDYADTLEKKIDFYKANKVKEQRILRNLKSLRENQARLKAEIAKKL